MGPKKTSFVRNNVKPRVLMSTLGRSHFIVAADSLVRHGVDLDLLQGWVPRNLKSWAVRFCARIIKRKSFTVGLSKRMTPALEGRVIAEPLPELVSTISQLSVARFGRRWEHLGVRISFRMFGFLTRKHLKEHVIFHVKSGLGQGGAIKHAHGLGMKVLVDHCTPHPNFMGESSGAVGYKEPWTFWVEVLKDCAEADLLMVGSDFIKETFVERGYPAERIRVVPLGILSQFRGAKTTYRKSGPMRLIYTGGWKYEKGASFLVDAVELLVQKGVDCHLSVFGSYASHDEFVIRCQNLPITLHGHVPQDDLRQFLAEADIYIFPSLSDGFAVSAIEGMAAGLCMITTRESSIRIEEGVTGYVVLAKSGEAIAERVIYLDQHREVVEHIGRRAAEMVKTTYTWEMYAENVEKVYEELLEK